jgi:hypothetical protein
MDLPRAANVSRCEKPDVALVGLSESSEHALHLVEKIVHESASSVPPFPFWLRQGIA